MSVLVLSGSPSRQSSRADALGRYVGERLRRAGAAVTTIGVHDVPASELIAADRHGSGAHRLQAAVEEADALVVAMPVYDASLPGGLKALLDLLPPRSLADKPVLPLASHRTAPSR